VKDDCALREAMLTILSKSPEDIDPMKGNARSFVENKYSMDVVAQ
jgi:hypothetical protein